MRDIVNTEQEQAWNGPEGTHWADHQSRWDAVNDGFNEPILDAAGITGPDRVLDIGCGSGRTTRLAARRAAQGRALGIDLSAPMLERARASAVQEGIGNVTFERADAQVHAFPPASFDAALSRYGVMFFADPVAAFANIGGALRPGGRLAFVCPAEAARNGWVQAVESLRDLVPLGDYGKPGEPGMFSLAEPDRIRAVLSEAGFRDVAPERVEAYGTWGRDADDAAAFLLGTGPGRYLTSQLSPETLDRAVRTLTDHLRAHEDPDHGGAVRLRSTAWLVTAQWAQ